MAQVPTRLWFSLSHRRCGYGSDCSVFSCSPRSRMRSPLSDGGLRWCLRPSLPLRGVSGSRWASRCPVAGGRRGLARSASEQPVTRQTRSADASGHVAGRGVASPKALRISARHMSARSPLPRSFLRRSIARFKSTAPRLLVGGAGGSEVGAQRCAWCRQSRCPKSGGVRAESCWSEAV